MKLKLINSKRKEITTCKIETLKIKLLEVPLQEGLFWKCVKL
jgi:hypothetical protein